MKLFNKISSFFAPTAETANLVGEITDSNVELVAYAASLASSPDIVATQLEALKAIKDQVQDNKAAALGKIYLEIEAKLIESDPGRTFNQASIRKQVLEHVKPEELNQPFILLFAHPLQQQIGLAMVILDRLVQAAKQTIGLNVMESLIHKSLVSTSLSRLQLKDGHIDFQQTLTLILSLPEEQLRLLLSDLTRLFQEINDNLRELQGVAWSDQLFSQAYFSTKKDFSSYMESMPVVSSMMPEGLLEDERLGLLSRETLTQKVKEATQQLIQEKASVEQKVIDRTKELHAEQAKLKASIEALSLGFVIVDKEDKIITTNHALLTLLNWKTGAILTLKDMRNLFKNFDIVEINDAVRVAGEPRTVQNISMGAKILQLFFAPVTVTDNEGSTMLGTVIVFEDTTEAKVMERSRDEFFSIASHELRTPLTAIRGNASLIEEYYKKQIKDPDLRNMVGDIKDSSVRLISIVNDFLDMSRIEQGKMQFHLSAISLDKIIEKVFYEMREVLQNKNLYLNIDNRTLGELPKIWADEIPVTQIIYNLIGNAVKFTEKGGVDVSCEAVGNFVTVTVTDSGRGISLENQKLLFHKFQQAADSLLTRDTTRGTGLGLYISKLMAEGMGGTIYLEESEEGKGSSFVFKIPVATESQVKDHSGDKIATIDTTTGIAVKK